MLYLYKGKFLYNGTNSTISFNHKNIIKLGICSTGAIGSMERSLSYPLTNLSFERPNVISLSSPSFDSYCYSMGNDGNAWDCQHGSWAKDPMRPALIDIQ